VVNSHCGVQGRYMVGVSPEKHVLTNDNGLVVISLSEADSGRYDCLYRGQLVSSYHIAVDTHRLGEKKWFLLQFSLLFPMI
jgi:hypothetical protein